SRFLQIHTLTSYPSALLNRDDVGFAKRVSFGGATRTRISSQCLKRHWRTFEGENAIRDIAPPSVRSRASFERFVYEPLVASGVESAVADAITEALIAEVLGESAKAKREKAEGKTKKGKKENLSTDREPLSTNQVTVLGRPELDFLAEEGRAIAKKCASSAVVPAAVKEHFTRELRENLRVMRMGAGLDAALFGRMVTSDILARGDAAIHVAHAFTTHAEEAESDYFSAVDDLLKERDGLGSGHIGSVELTSGLYYGYVVVDVPLLVSNIEGGDRREWTSRDRALASEIVRRLVRLVATVSPGAKLGSTAPYAYAHMVLVEAGNAQPRTLANAFVSPVRANGDLIGNAYGAVAEYLRDLDSMYGAATQRRLSAVGPADRLAYLGAERGDLEATAAWAAEQVRG
ncbi:MAG: type I-E CRISPR-associated protein Cas7/Cse4/CasC, partial [Polyangiaceae bacterium]|nr:type I-E CRISPR-associated protein Cas7/Cse4/CasC [Polyangiaceae bacterium]